ncbi:MAG TPA: (Fe-S)-binding protein [Vicinamibacterales bacterium]|nr:(Fe-S)-binding protein [Vicinamibacterales bacterium]
MATVQLFHTCLINEFAPQAGMSVVRVLERLGYTVEVPDAQTCCGQPAFNAGFQDEARTAARHTIAVLEATDGPIVLPSGSCGDMVIHQYLALFHDDLHWRERAAAVAARCEEFSSFVARHHAVAATAPIDATVAYHPSCHLLRGLGIDAEPKRLIAQVPGVTRVPLAAEDECCGFGGLFAIKHADISTRMLERKIAQVIASGAQRLVSCDMGCLLHLAGGLHRRGIDITVQHLAELLDRGDGGRGDGGRGGLASL